MSGRTEGGITRHARAALSLLITLLATSHAAHAAPSKAEVESQFERWVQADLWPEAQKSGISEKTFKAAFAGVTLDWSLNDLAPPGFPPPKEVKQTQAEFSSPAPYFNDDRLKRLAVTGRSFQTQYASTLKKIEKTYGVPGSIVLAIWGRETGFGPPRSRIPASRCWPPRPSCPPARRCSAPS